MSFILVKQIPNSCDYTENGWYMCNSYVIWLYQHFKE